MKNIFSGEIISLMDERFRPDPRLTTVNKIYSDSNQQLSLFKNDSIFIEMNSIKIMNKFLMEIMNTVNEILYDDYTNNETKLKMIDALFESQLKWYGSLKANVNVSVYFTLYYIINFMSDVYDLEPGDNLKVNIKSQYIHHINKNSEDTVIKVFKIKDKNLIIINNSNEDLFFNLEMSSAINLFLISSNILIKNESDMINNFKKNQTSNVIDYLEFLKNKIKV